MKIQLLLSVLLAAVTAPTLAVADVSLGDIAIIGFRSDTADGFAFVAVSPISNNDAITFWDSGFIGPGTGEAGGGNWRGTETSLVWTNNTGAELAAGTVVVVSANTADVGTVSSGSLTGLSTGGDQIFAGFGGTAPSGNPSEYDGTLLYGIHFDGSDWDAPGAGVNSSNESALPTTLANHNLAIPEVDNSQYTGSRTFSNSADLLAAVRDISNWSGNNDGAAFGSLNSTDFSIAVPEPSSAGLVALCGLQFLRRRNRRQ